MPRQASQTPAPTAHPRKGRGVKMNRGSAKASSARSRTRSGVRGSEVTEAGDDQADSDADALEEADDPERDRQPGERAEPEADRRAEDDRSDDQAPRDGRARPARSGGSAHPVRWDRSRACRKGAAIRPRAAAGTLEGREPARGAGRRTP